MKSKKSWHESRKSAIASRKDVWRTLLGMLTRSCHAVANAGRDIEKLCLLVKSDPFDIT